MASPQIAADHFSSDTREFLRLLDRQQVEYLIVGGEAVIFHGHVRLTGDVDFFYSVDDANVERLYNVLLEFWNGDIPGSIEVSDLAIRGQIIQFGVPPNRIDLLNEIDGVAFRDAWPYRVVAFLASPVDSIIVPFIGLDQLVVNKTASGRPKDLDDLRFLRSKQG